MNIRLLSLIALIVSSITIMYGSEPATIHEAAAYGNMSKINEFIRKDESLLNKQNQHGYTPLHIMLIPSDSLVGFSRTMFDFAMHYSNHENVPQFIRNNPALQLDLKDKWGNTPLHYATKRHHEATITMLLLHGANRLMLNNKGEAPQDDEVCQECWRRIHPIVNRKRRAQQAFMMGLHPRTGHDSPVSLWGEDIARQIIGYVSRPIDFK